MMLIFVFLGLLVNAEAEVTPLVVQTGKDLLLEVKEAVTLERDDRIVWSFNGKNIARCKKGGKPIIYTSHLRRAELSPQNLSLLLRSLIKGDSGDYRARICGDNQKVVAEHKVTVLDPVSPVTLTVKTCSSDSSNLTVSCSTQDSLISNNFTCDNQSCSKERGEREESTTPAASLKVYLKKDTIICVHSNQVSRMEDIKKIEQIEDFCKKDPGPESFFDKISACKVKIFVTSFGLIVMFFAVLSVHIMERIRKRN